MGFSQEQKTVLVGSDSGYLDVAKFYSCLGTNLDGSTIYLHVASNMKEYLKFKEISLYGAYLILIPAVALLSMEAGLAFMNRLAGYSRFTALKTYDYPDYPERYVKIAIFGGSAANGYNSERGFIDILQYDLQKKYPDKKFFIKNYAKLLGGPFHRYGAELVKKTIGKFDTFIIYAGDNEALNYLDSIGYGRDPKYKHISAFGPPETMFDNNLITKLEYHSLLYAWVKRKTEFFTAKLAKREDRPVRITQKRRTPQEFEPEKLLPPDEIEKIYSNFKKDLEEIAALADKYNKTVIISNVATNESYKPFFSVHKPSLSDRALEDFNENYRQGLAEYERGAFESAISYFLKAKTIDDQPAILHYMIGSSYLFLGKLPESWPYFRESIDEDGMPLRSLGGLHKISEAVAQKNEHVYYVDVINNFHKALTRAVSYEELFNDLHHPSLMGHVIIARTLLCEMEQLEVFEGPSSPEFCVDFNSEDIRSMLAHYSNELKVSPSEKMNNAFMIARWHFNVATDSAYSQDYLTVAENYIRRYQSFAPKNFDVKAVTLLYLALIETKRGNLSKVLYLANEALQSAPEYIEKTLYGQEGLPARDNLIFGFEDVGITYSKDKRLFVRR